MIGRFLSKNWPVVLAILGVAVLFTQNRLLDARNDTLTATIEARDATIDGLGSQIETQNNAVRAMKAAADVNRDVYVAGLAAAENRAIRLEIEAGDILSLPSPETPQEQCRYARELLIGD